MTMDGVNGQQPVTTTFTTTAQASTPEDMGSVSQSMNKALQDGLSGADRKIDAPETETLTPNERKAWIKEYQNTHNCTKKEAMAAFDREFGKIDKMSHKEAKAWVKDYMAKNDCSKKEAKAAFKEKFGYDVPLSLGAKIDRALLMVSGGSLLQVLGLVDTATGGKAGVKKFVSGQGNNDAKYVKNETEL